MSYLVDFLKACGKVHQTGAAVPETSYYPALDALLSGMGASETPPVYAVTHVSGRGGEGSRNSGIPDLGLFCDSVETSGLERGMALGERLPERGVVEVKPPSERLDRVVSSAQVRNYLGRYGKVVVTNLREWRILRLNEAGKGVEHDRATLADSEESFWALTDNPEDLDGEVHQDVVEFLKRALEGEGAIARVDDLARFMGAQAKHALRRLEDVEIGALDDLRMSLEAGLGMQFHGESGERFFKSTLVQSLFYGVFSAWVLSRRKGEDVEDFRWRSSHWHLRVPVVQALFEQIAKPAHLKPLGLDRILDGTQETLRRVDTSRFFAEFDEGFAVQYFYEPFIGYFDPDLRTEYGIWYTPPEVVDYMVEHVDQALRSELGRENGLADENVWVLDPCVGTGSFLLAVANKIKDSLPDDGLAGEDLKKAVLSRLIGFELLPAPFVVSHLQLGLCLATAGAPLGDGERSAVYLTNSLTGWTDDELPRLPFKEFEAERQAASEVKQHAPILVVIGNPPYNGYASVTTKEEHDLVAPYRESIDTKNSLGDLYVRFFRIAERQIAERSGQGLICYISNFSYIHESGFVSMRDHLRSSFDDIYIDNLNGDSRETGKRTPDGAPDPSIFSTKFNRAGIQTGTAIGLFVRGAPPVDSQRLPAVIHYREFWGKTKRSELAALAAGPSTFEGFETVEVRPFNHGSFRPSVVADDYHEWTSIRDLATFVELGPNENRGSALIDPTKSEVADRVRRYLDPEISMAELATTASGPLTRKYAGFDPEKTRSALTEAGFDDSKLRRMVASPMDYQWAYVEEQHKLWNRSRPELLRHLDDGAKVLLLRNRAPRLQDGVPMLPCSALGNQHALHKDAYHIPLEIRTEASTVGGMFADEKEPNLSDWAKTYLAGVGIESIEDDYATVIWYHCLAISSSPAYEHENSGGITADWPRIPLPDNGRKLRQSARLGQTVWSLLDPTEVPKVALPQIGEIRSSRPNGAVDVNAGDLKVTAGWSRLQQGSKVMPSSGSLTWRSPVTEEEVSASSGMDVCDVYLNESTFWAGIPKRVWDLKIGGYQVLKKWLSYREHGPTTPSPLLGRSLTAAEVREFTDIVRRLSSFLEMGEELDANYHSIR